MLFVVCVVSRHSTAKRGRGSSDSDKLHAMHIFDISRMCVYGQVQCAKTGQMQVPVTC